MRPISCFRLQRIKRVYPCLMLWGALMGTSKELSAQTSFIDMSNQLGILSDHTGGYLGAGISVADFNDDGIDDLSLAHHGGEMKFYLGNGEGFNDYFLNLSDYPFEAKSVVWVDIDNDGDQDLFITYRLEPNRMYLNHGGLVMEDITETCGILSRRSSELRREFWGL